MYSITKSINTVCLPFFLCTYNDTALQHLRQSLFHSVSTNFGHLVVCFSHDSILWLVDILLCGSLFENGARHEIRRKIVRLYRSIL